MLALLDSSLRGRNWRIRRECRARPAESTFHNESVNHGCRAVIKFERRLLSHPLPLGVSPRENPLGGIMGGGRGGRGGRGGPEFEANPVQPVLTSTPGLISGTSGTACATAHRRRFDKRRKNEEVHPSLGVPVGSNPRQGRDEASAPEISRSKED